MSTFQDDATVSTLLADIRDIAQQQTELTLTIAEGLLESSKSIVSQVRFDSLAEADTFLQTKRDEMMTYANQLHELIASCYLDDLIGQKVMKIEKALQPALVSSKIADSMVGNIDAKKIEINSEMLNPDLMTPAAKMLTTPFRQPQLM